MAVSDAYAQHYGSYVSRLSRMLLPPGSRKFTCSLAPLRAHRLQPANHNGADDPVTVEDDVLERPVNGKGVAQALAYPCRYWITRCARPRALNRRL